MLAKTMSRSAGRVCLEAANVVEFSIESCAGVSDTLPDVACGQMKRPRSKHLANSIRPWPSNHSTLRMSPRPPRRTKTWPQNGLATSAVCATAANPSKPFLMSV